MSSLMLWYEKDFVSDTVPTVLDYVVAFLPEDRRSQLEQARANGYAIEFTPYDWRLNDQHTGR